MPIEHSLLNLWSICRVIRHKSLSKRIYAIHTIQKLLASLTAAWNIEVPVEDVEAANWLHNLENQQRHRATLLNPSKKCKKGNSSSFPGFGFEGVIGCNGSTNQEQFWSENCQTRRLLISELDQKEKETCAAVRISRRGSRRPQICTPPLPTPEAEQSWRGN